MSPDIFKEIILKTKYLKHSRKPQRHNYVQTTLYACKNTLQQQAQSQSSTTSKSVAQHRIIDTIDPIEIITENNNITH